MNNELNPNLPLEFQKVEKFEKRKGNNPKKTFTEIKFYQSSKIVPQNFYKPISKIVKFEL